MYNSLSIVRSGNDMDVSTTLTFRTPVLSDSVDLFDENESENGGEDYRAQDHRVRQDRGQREVATIVVGNLMVLLNCIISWICKTKPTTPHEAEHAIVQEGYLHRLSLVSLSELSLPFSCTFQRCILFLKLGMNRMLSMGLQPLSISPCSKKRSSSNNARAVIF